MLDQAPTRSTRSFQDHTYLEESFACGLSPGPYGLAAMIGLEDREHQMSNVECQVRTHGDWRYPDILLIEQRSFINAGTASSQTPEYSCSQHASQCDPVGLLFASHCQASIILFLSDSQHDFLDKIAPFRGDSVMNRRSLKILCA